MEKVTIVQHTDSEYFENAVNQELESIYKNHYKYENIQYTTTTITDQNGYNVVLNSAMITYVDNKKYTSRNL